MISTVEVCRLTGCTYRQLDYWCRCSVFGPGRVAAGGSGARRAFTREEVEEVAVVTRVARTAGGSKCEALAATVARLRQHPGMTGWVVVDHHARKVTVIADLETLAVFSSAVIVRLDLCRFDVLELEASVV